MVTSLARSMPLRPGKPRAAARAAVRIDVVAGHDAAVLRPLLAQDAGQPAGIDVGDGHHLVLAQILVKGFSLRQLLVSSGRSRITRPAGKDVGRLLVFGIGAGIADVGIGQGDDLAGIGRVGEDFLIAGHGGIEHHLADGLPLDTDGLAPEQVAVFKSQQRRLPQGDDLQCLGMPSGMDRLGPSP